MRYFEIIIARIKSRRYFSIFLGIVLLNGMCSIVMAQMSPSWVWPMYKTGNPVEKQMTVVDVYNYREIMYDPPIVVNLVSKKERHNGTPEEAMISRVSAMMTLDFEWWLETWDSTSRKEILENDRKAGRTKEYWIQWWKDSFGFARIMLIRRIESGPYVILTYRLTNEQGKDVGRNIEYPSVFHSINKKWYSTVELASDPLIPKSPWVTGNKEENMTVR